MRELLDDLPDDYRFEAKKDNLEELLVVSKQVSDILEKNNITMFNMAIALNEDVLKIDDVINTRAPLEAAKNLLEKMKEKIENATNNLKKD